MGGCYALKIPGLGNCVRVLTAAGICKIQEKALTRTLAPKGRTRSALKIGVDSVNFFIGFVLFLLRACVESYIHCCSKADCISLIVYSLLGVFYRRCSNLP